MKESLRDIIYLSSSQTLPPYLKSLRGVRWRWAQNLEGLKQILATQQQEIYVIVRVDIVTERMVKAFLSWTQMKAKMFFIFIAQTIEKSAYQHSLQIFERASLLFLRESEGRSITSILTRCFSGGSIKSRKQERLPVKVAVMLKKSQILTKSPTGNGVQFLREGEMKDFSQGGALITIPQGRGVHPKDFLSLMYKNQKGKWVAVESQVRWVASTSQGEQIIGVQFLAVST